MEPGARAGAALASLATRHHLSEHQQGQLAALLVALEADARAPTAVRSAGRAVDVHIADSLAALELEPVRSAETIADIGAGAGFPGLPLAIALVASDVRLLDSQTRKCIFLEKLLAAVGVENARAVCARAEEWPDGEGAHDLVLARAVAGQAVVVEYAAPLLRLGGALVDWRGRRALDEEEVALRAATIVGLERVSVTRSEPFAGARDHHLHLYLKVRETPERFPRRAGMAAKRPLGAV
jgi:16S rRNA (guanine527-N7)-methyltransferase